MKNILIIGGTKGIGKSIVDDLVDHNNITCLSRNKPEFQHQNYAHMENLMPFRTNIQKWII